MKHRAVALITVVLAFAANARAGDVTLAEALFREGKALMADGKFDQACPKLEESYEQDAATGTLLALALCLEEQGKLATAWATYSEVAARAKLEGNAEREEVARERVKALEPRLSTFTLEVPEALASNASVRHDGEIVPRVAWGSPIPANPGAHTIEVSAPGHKPWKQDFALAPEADARVIHVPLLEPEPSQPVAPSAPDDSTKARPLRIAAYASVGVSVASAALGMWFAVRSKQAFDDANELCPSFPCELTSQDYDERNDLADDGESLKTASIISFVVAGVGLGAGITLFVLSGDAESAPTQPTARVEWTPGGGLGSFTLQGSF